jgi:outer membrane protein OmpA-like peptidoglycan-associated protein
LGFHPQPSNGTGFKVVLAREVAFAVGSAEMTPQAREAVAGLTQELAGHPLLHFTVVGHTDDSGPAAYNAALSLSRARAFAAILTEAGVPSEQITSEGRGAAEPLTRGTQDGIPARAMNRRIEIHIQDAGLP